MTAEGVAEYEDADVGGRVSTEILHSNQFQPDS
jgi:hypothetical protein